MPTPPVLERRAGRGQSLRLLAVAVAAVVVSAGSALAAGPPPWAGGRYIGAGSGANQKGPRGLDRFTLVVASGGTQIHSYDAEVATYCGVTTATGPMAGQGVGGIIRWPISGGPPPVGPPLPIDIRPNGTFRLLWRSTVHFARVIYLSTRPVSGTVVFTMDGAFRGHLVVSGHVSLRISFNDHRECLDTGSSFTARR